MYIGIKAQNYILAKMVKIKQWLLGPVQELLSELSKAALLPWLLYPYVLTWLEVTL